jgi:hypothetical protein
LSEESLIADEGRAGGLKRESDFHQIRPVFFISTNDRDDKECVYGPLGFDGLTGSSP